MAPAWVSRPKNGQLKNLVISKGKWGSPLEAENIREGAISPIKTSETTQSLSSSRELAPLNPCDLRGGSPVVAATEFQRCWPWLLASLQEFFQTHTKDHVWYRILDGRAYFWPGQECAIIGQLVKHPIGIKSFNYWLQGGKLDELLTMHPGIEAWAKSRGCTVATGLGREGWARAMNDTKDWKPGDPIAARWQKGPTTRIKWL